MAHPGGRPQLFTDPEDLERQINEYFAECDKGKDVKHVTKRGEVVSITKPIPYTLEGLALYLGCDSSTLRNYEKKDEFFKTISRAREKVFNNWIEGGLMDEYNPKIAALVLAANARTYNVKQESEITVQTIEQKLKAIEGQRGNKQIEHDDNVTDGEIVEN